MRTLLQGRVAGIPLAAAWALLLAMLAAMALWDRMAVALDPSDRFVDRGVTGPYAWANQRGQLIETGPVIRSAPPGESFAIVSTFCPERDESYIAVLRLVRVDDGAVLWTRRKHFEATERSCGERVGTFQIPADARPGLHRIEREAIFDALRGQATGRRAILQGLTIEVQP